MKLTERYEEAFHYALELHRRQIRKGSSVPYLAHLLGVSALVIEDGGSEDEAIAALLHDGPEDQGGMAVLEEIRRRFGDKVAEIVDGCTDTYETPKPDWRERKERYLVHLLSASPQILRVSLADKLHNARSIRSDLQRSGAAVWRRFNGGKEGTLWYYQSLAKAYRQRTDSPMVSELEEVVRRIVELAQS